MDREGWNRRWQERGSHCADDANDLLATELAPLTPGRALDLGCGAGRSAICLAERGWLVTAVDFSDVALGFGFARAHGSEVDWVLADLRGYEPEAEAFDLVLVLYVHLPPGERRPFLARAAQALAPGGTIIVAGHDLTNLGSGAPGPSNPDVLYTPERIERELPGLEVRKAERVTRRVETGEGEAVAIDTLVVAGKA
jgi:SAM-dependent methyltransferase